MSTTVEVEAPVKTTESDEEMEELLDSIDDDKVVHLVEYVWTMGGPFRPVTTHGLCGASGGSWHRHCPGTGPRPLSKIKDPCEYCGAKVCAYCIFIWDNMMKEI